MTRRIVSHSGRYVTSMEGVPSIEDIALALCRTAVFVGQTEDFYSLAHHCIHVSSLMPENRIYGLLSEAHVAVLGGCPATFQDAEYRRFVIQLQRALCSEYELVPYDKRMRMKVGKASAIASAAAARVCGLPNADEMFPMSKDVMSGMEFVHRIELQFPAEENLKPNSQLQRYFIAKFQSYLAIELAIQVEGTDKDGGDDEFGDA